MGTSDGRLTSATAGRIDLVEEDGVRVLRLRGEVDTLAVAAWRAAPPATPGALATVL